MAINFRLLFQQTGKLILLGIMELRGFYWNLSFNKNKIFSIKILPGHKIKYSRKGDIGEIIYKNEVLVKYKKSFEYSTLQLFSKILKRGDVIIDVGANSGLYSIFYSKLIGDGGAVYSFEPDISTFSLLQKNLALNNCGNVHAYNCALSDKECSIEMVAANPVNINLKSADSFKFMKEVIPYDKARENHSIKAFKLDDIEELKPVAKIDCIKIDVEGAELLVLQGGIKTISKYKPIIIFELSGEWTRRFNYKPFQLLVLLNELGYQMDEYDFQQWIAKPVK
ncbi:MAG: FkbM family methyltransferase [Ginsengibacter sp.]